VFDIIQKYDRMPFRYGLDCCRFAAECVESITGKNPMAGIEYSNEAEAYAIIDRHGDLEGALRAHLGEPYDGRKDGDVILAECSDGSQLAGIIFNGVCVVRTKVGIADWPIRRARLVWET